jgi:hypothetical protein
VAIELFDALTIARWCWPNLIWQGYGDRGENWAVSAKPGEPVRFSETWFEIHAAEAVALERGLGEELARELWRETSGDSYVAGGYGAADLARVAFAPRPARVRALAAVIRARERSKSGDVS